MKLESYKTIRIEDFKDEARETVERISNSVNPLGSQLLDLTTNKVNITDNLTQELKSLNIEVASTGVPLQDTTFVSKFGTKKVTGIQVVRAENISGGTTYVSGAPFISFTQSEKLIKIQHITGIPASTKFKITLITIFD